MRTGNASGVQVTFLSFAVLLLAVPVSMLIGDALGSSKDEAAFIGRFVPFVLGAVALVAFPSLRRHATEFLSNPVGREYRGEVALAALSNLGVAFAAVGGVSLWYWLTEGNAALEQHLKSAPADLQMAQAFSPLGFLGGWVSSQAWFVCRPAGVLGTTAAPGTSSFSGSADEGISG